MSDRIFRLIWRQRHLAKPSFVIPQTKTSGPIAESEHRGRSGLLFGQVDIHHDSEIVEHLFFVLLGDG